MTPSYPIFDLHCDLLVYLAHTPGAEIDAPEDIGVALTHLNQGRVRLQVMAVFSKTMPGSEAFADAEWEKYAWLREQAAYQDVRDADSLPGLKEGPIGILPAIENASGLCGEDSSLQDGLKRLEAIHERFPNLLYIGMTHHTENRFGGGNNSGNVGLKNDGRALLDAMDGRNICIDLAHTSDALAADILHHIDQQGLNIPVLVSHANFRPINQHVRNLTDEIVQEVIRRGGLIGINFVRDFVNRERADTLFDHIEYGWQFPGGEQTLAWGGDFFDPRAITDPDRQPLFHPEHAHAGFYPTHLQRLAERGASEERLQAFAYQNVLNFLQKRWTA
ncbi:MAG: membrane dipeptidase [Bacteroidota bacterium]